MSDESSEKLPQISDAEWVVMKVLWQREPRTSKEVIEALEGQTDWKPQTIQTLLGRLVAKGALGYKKKGREYLYHSLVTAPDCEYAASRSFLGRCFNGELAPFLTRFLEKENLTEEEIAKLKDILNKPTS